eukprot:365826-Chlamydomonas_euryale.AAC.7
MARDGSIHVPAQLPTATDGAAPLPAQPLYGAVSVHVKDPPPGSLGGGNDSSTAKRDVTTAEKEVDHIGRIWCMNTFLVGVCVATSSHAESVVWRGCAMDRDSFRRPHCSWG